MKRTVHWQSERPGLERALLAALGVFTAVAVAGYGTFGRHPAWLAALPGDWSGSYGWTYVFFARGQVWLAALVLLVWLSGRVRAAWVPALGAAYAISLVAELSGTSRGIPFGGYAYSELLGPAWFGRVPILIPLSWFCMALPSWAFGQRVYPDSAPARVALGSFVLVTWDLALDPAMSHATRFWVWAESGPYYGMPWLNLFGWYVTGAAILLGFEWVGVRRWCEHLKHEWLYAFYALNLLMPLGMCVGAGLWPAVGVTLASLAVLAAWAFRSAARRATLDETPASSALEMAR